MVSFAWRHRQAIHGSGGWRPGSRSRNRRSRPFRAGRGPNNEPERHGLGANRPKPDRPGRDQRQRPGHRDRRSTRTTPTSFTSAQHGAASGSRATGVTPGRRSSIERPRSAWAIPGALAIDPVNTNILYVGTSSREGSQFSGEATQPPAGLFKSTDGGASWIRLGLRLSVGPAEQCKHPLQSAITVVIVDPANTQTLYLASSAGLFVSTDGGFNWTQGVAPAGDVRSLSLDTTSPAGARILYAGVSGVGVVQSTDGGRNWNTILNAATPAVAAALAGGGFGKVVVALAPAASPAKPRRHPGALRHDGRNRKRAELPSASSRARIRAIPGALEPPRDWRV